MTGLLGGESDMMFTTMPIAVPHIDSGRLRALAVASATRTARLPELPTLAEAGVPGVEITGWVGVMVPRGTPKAIVGTLHKDICRNPAGARRETAPDRHRRRSGWQHPRTIPWVSRRGNPKMVQSH